MVIIADGFDAAKGYKRIGFREDRDLLDTELNELQEIAIHEHTVLMDRLFAPGSIVDGLDGAIAGDTVTLDDGVVYLDGHAVSVPGAVLTFPEAGLHTIWLDVFRRIITVADDPTLLNPLTGEPTAEREKWIATLQTRDTTNDPWPAGATGRTVVALYTFNRDTGELLPVVPRVVHPADPVTLASHIGHGGTTQHPAVTPTEAGFMAPDDKTKLDQLSPTTPPAHIHDDRYYTKSIADAQLATKADVTHQHDTRYAPLSHVGAGDGAHAAATPATAGFLSAADKAKLDVLSTTPPAHTHDDRYYTETEIDVKLAAKSDTGHNHDTAYAPLAHVGAGGAAHPAASSLQAGFMTPADKAHADAAQRVATVVVAAADASPVVKAAADFVCTGTNDQAVILQAIDALPEIPDLCADIEFTDRTPDGGHILIRAVRPGPEGNALTIAFIAGVTLTVTVNQMAIQVTYPATATISQLATAINQAAGDIVFSHVVKYGPMPMLPSVPQPLTGGTMTRAGAVALSEGTFYIYQPIKQNNVSRLTLSGHQSVLRLVDSSYQWALEDATIVLIGCAWCTIEGLTFVGVGGANELDGILFTGTDMVIRDCRFVDTGQNAVDAQGDRNAIVNCSSQNAGSYFVIIRQGDHCRVSGCRSEADAGGVALESCDQSLIEGNVIANTVSMQGVSIANSRGVTLSGNVITYPATAGVEVAGGHNVQVTNNQIIHAASDANRWGVRFTGTGDFALVSGNLLVCPANQFEFYESGQYATKLVGSGLNLRHSTLG
ncbi:MAG: right-handed parallel beta-helix repeat-containing protein [Armatimonadota bacterium]